MAKKITETKKKTTKSAQKKERGKESDKDSKIINKMKKTKISVIGIGGGGGSIVSEIASILSGASFIAANTDTQALEAINKNVKPFSFGQKLTQGLGTGMNVDLAKEVAQNEKEEIKKLCQGQDLCIIVASLGGGTGSGAASVFAKASRSSGSFTYGIFTLPFEFEGKRKMEIAKDALKRIKNELDIITIIPNERVFKIVNKDTPLKEALSIINKNLAKSLGGLIETIYKPGLINIDFADFKTIFRSKGKLTYLNTVEVLTKENSIKDLVTQVLNSSLYSYNIQGAKGVLFNISGEKNLSLSEVSEMSKSISNLAGSEAKIIFGTRILANRKKTEAITRITLLAVGCGEAKNFLGTKKIKLLNTTKTKKEKKIEKPKKLKKLERPKKLEKITKPEDKILIKSLENKIITEKVGTKIKINTSPTSASGKGIRKNGVQIKKDAEDFEKDILKKEKAWEIPAFLRRKPTK